MGAPARNPELSSQPRPTLEPASSGSASNQRAETQATIDDFSIVLGGPLYDFLQRAGFVRIELPNVMHRIVTVVGLTWLSLLLLSMKDGVALGHKVQVPFLYDFSVYGRFVLCLPLLFFAEVMIDPAIRMSIREFVEAGLVPDHALPEFQRILRTMQRLRDSWIPEVVIFVLAFFPVFLFQHEWTSGAISSWHTTAGGLTTAGWWFAIFSAPLLRFMIYRWIFRYALWSLLLRRISQLPLTLTPTHPDHAAGLNFLGLAQKRFGILFCALGCTFAGRVANSMVFEGASVASFKALMVGFIVLSLIFALLPLLLLAPKLAKVRKAGLLEYGRLANGYTASFDRKWVHNQGPPSEPLLGTSDIQSLADMGNSFAFVESMTIAPITKRLVIQLAVQAALPLLPLIILGTPTPELIRAVMKMVA